MEEASGTSGPVSSASSGTRPRRDPRSLAEAIGQGGLGMAVVRLDGTYVSANRSFCSLVGVDPDQVVGSQWGALVAGPNLDPASWLEVPDLDEDGACIQAEAKIVTESGDTRHLLLQINPITGNGSGPALFFVVAVRIDSLKEREQSLIRDRTLIQLMKDVAGAANEAATLEAAVASALRLMCLHMGWEIGHAFFVSEDGDRLQDSGIWVGDEGSSFEGLRAATASISFAAGVGLPGRALQRRSPVWVADVLKDESFQRSRFGTEIGIRTGFAFPVEEEEKVIAVLELFHHAPLEEDERAMEIAAYVGDQIARVCERESARRALAGSEGKFRSLAQSAQDAIVLSDRRGDIVFWNQAAERMFAYGQDEVLGKPVSMLMPDRFISEHIRGLNRARTSGYTGLAVELTGKRRDGNEFPLELSLAEWESEGETFYTGVIRDISERKRAEVALQGRRRLYETLLEGQSALGLGIAVGNSRTTEAVFVNDALADMTGYGRDELLAMPGGLISLSAPEEVESLLEHLRREIEGESQKPVFETAFLRKDGTRVEVEVAMRLMEKKDSWSSIAIVRDITDRKAAEERARQASKMEAVGRVAGGVAHDFNNLLTAMKGNCELMRVDPALPEEFREQVAEVEEAVDVAASISGRLLDVSRSRVVDRQVLDMNEIVSSMEDLLRRFIREDVRFAIFLAGSPLYVQGDRGQLEQILLNLVINAGAATSAGTITVGTAAIDVDVEMGHRLDVSPGGYVRLSVTDTGAGIAPEHLEHVLDLFFTTKDPATAAGLGLSIVYNSLMQWGGRLKMESGLGRGSRFDVYLPLVPEGPDEVHEERQDSVTDATILLVEDEPRVRAVAVRSLRRAGYEVLEAADGPDALDVARRCDGAIDVLVTDIVMPGMSGHDLAREMLSAREDLLVLYTSGYAEELAAEEEGASSHPFLAKPFSPETLVAEVSRLLRGAALLEG